VAEAPPDELLPPERHPCEEVDRLARSKRGTTEGTRKFVEGWFCANHCGQQKLLEQQRRLLSEEDPEAGETGALFD